MTAIVSFNGTDAATYGFQLIDAPELFGTGEIEFQTMPLVQRAGVYLGSARPSVQPRRLRLSGFISGTSLSDATTKLDNLKALINTSACAITTAWATTRRYFGVLVNAPAGPNSAFWDKFMAVELEFLLFDPYGYDETFTTVNFTTSPTDIPLGTASSKGNAYAEAIITITGAATTPILRYRDADGDLIAEMSFTGYSPLASDFITINLSRGLVTKSVSGVKSNAMGALAAGWNFPAIDAADGDYLATDWPTLEVTSGSGSITYYKAYR